MATLSKNDLILMENQIKAAKGVQVLKEDVLSIIQEKLKEVDSKNDFIVDRIDGVCLKNVLNEINKL